jgi:K+-transporting ATPase ATPase A chain
MVIFLVTKPIGVFMARVFNREKTFLDPVLRPVERLVYRLTGVDEKREMRWTEYAVAMLLFSGVSMTLLYLIERTQKWLPFNPQKFPNVEPGLAFGTAASFTIPILACGFRPSLRRSSDALGRHRHLL